MFDNILKIYIFLPFLIVLLCLFCFLFRKNNLCAFLSKIYSIFNLILSTLFLTKIQYFTYKTEAVFLFILSVVVFSIAFISKNYIQKYNSFFNLALVLLCGILNLFILSNNIFLSLGLIFCFFIISYFLNCTFILKKDKKRTFEYQLIYDFILCFISLFLISCLKLSDFSFLNIAHTLPFCDKFALICAFFGFLILGLRLLNFSFFSFKSIKNADLLNNLVFLFLFILSLISGCVFLYKTFDIFNMIFQKYQNIITSYFIFNFIYLIFLSYKQNSMFKILAYCNCAYLSLAFLVLFSNKSSNIFIYYIFTLIFSYFLSLLIGVFIYSKLKIKDVFEFKKLKKEDKTLKALILYSFLNIINTPFLGLFIPFLFCILEISKNQDFLWGIFVIAFGCFIGVCSIYNLLNKILIEPVDYREDGIILRKTEGFIFSFLILIIIFSGLFILKDGFKCLMY